MIDEFTEKVIELPLKEMEILINKAIRLFSNYAELFAKTIEEYITMPNAIDEVMLLLNSNCFRQHGLTASAEEES